MTVAAAQIKDDAEFIASLTPHQAIAMLLGGAVERIQSASSALSKGDESEAGLLMARVIEILAELRESLDFETGGDIAVNLDKLYEYVMCQLANAEVETGEAVLSESGQLLCEVKDAWENIAA